MFVLIPMETAKGTFKTFVGVDQTGATLDGGKRAKPLYACMLSAPDGRRGRWRLSPVPLASATRECLGEALSGIGRELDESVALVFDSVFGLPKKSWQARSRGGARELWKQLRATHEIEGFGRAASEKFFSRFRGANLELSRLPRRPCELLSGANSVFTTRPFQKNIQTGTFRIWKDLASQPSKWCNFWPFETKTTELPRAPWVFEGYPSLLWREVFGYRVRTRAEAARLLEAFSKMVGPIEQASVLARALSRDADLCDAAVLALGAAMLEHENRLWVPFKRFREVRGIQHEGWILGLACAEEAAQRHGLQFRDRK